MSITLLTLGGGDTDYVSKFNTNFSTIKTAVDALQVASESIVASTITAPDGLKALLGDTDSIIGIGSYLPSPSGSNLNVAGGYYWKASTKVTLTCDTTTILSFSGFANDTYYLHIAPNGVPYVNTSPTDALYSIAWAGGFGTVTRLANVSWGAADWLAAQTSTALGASFTKLDDRLEAGEALAASKADGGMTSKSVAGSTNVTLTSSEYKKRVIELTGVLTGNITVTAPASSGTDWIVANLTTGSFTLTFKGSSGSGIALTQNTRNHVYFNGTDIFRAAPAV